MAKVADSIYKLFLFITDAPDNKAGVFAPLSNLASHTQHLPAQCI
jgi:hypothetical protein